MSCLSLCAFCGNYDPVRCQSRIGSRCPVDSCPDYCEKQTAPVADHGGGLPEEASAFAASDQVIGDINIIAQKGSGCNV